MKKIKVFSVAYAALFLAVVSCSSIYAKNGSLGSETYKYPSQEKIDRQVDSVFRRLSTREKIAQIMKANF